MTDATDPFEPFRRLWAPLGIPVPGTAVPTLDYREIEKRISELKAVEGWLATNLNMLRMAIQGMEAQKSILQAMHSASEAANPNATQNSDSPPAPRQSNSNDLGVQSMMWPWALMQQAVQASAAGLAQATASGKAGKKDKRNK